MIFALAFALAVQEPVRVELNHDQYSAGDKARVYVRSAQDGYLVVLHADPAGRENVSHHQPSEKRNNQVIENHHASPQHAQLGKQLCRATT